MQNLSLLAFGGMFLILSVRASLWSDEGYAFLLRVSHPEAHGVLLTLTGDVGSGHLAKVLPSLSTA